MSTTVGSDIENNKFCEQVFTNMKMISNEDGDLLSQFDNNNENDTPVLERNNRLSPRIRDTTYQKMLINNHTDANKGKIRGNFYLEDIFGLCKTFKKVTTNLGFRLMLKSADSQDIINTSMDDDVNVTNNSLYLYIPNIVPSVETPLKFKEATQNNNRISFDEGCTESRLLSDKIAQVGSAQHLNSPKYLIRAHQTKDRLNTSD